MKKVEVVDETWSATELNRSVVWFRNAAGRQTKRRRVRPERELLRDASDPLCSHSILYCAAVNAPPPMAAPVTGILMDRPSRRPNVPNDSGRIDRFRENGDVDEYGDGFEFDSGRRRGRKSDRTWAGEGEGVERVTRPSGSRRGRSIPEETPAIERDEVRWVVVGREQSSMGAMTEMGAKATVVGVRVVWRKEGAEAMIRRRPSLGELNPQSEQPESNTHHVKHSHRCSQYNQSSLPETRSDPDPFISSACPRTTTTSCPSPSRLRPRRGHPHPHPQLPRPSRQPRRAYQAA